jgi:hypothetical protein
MTATAATSRASMVGLLLRPIPESLRPTTRFSAVVLYRYVDVGKLGPLPNMYEPTWALSAESASPWAEAPAVILAAAGMLTTRARTRGPAGRSSQRIPETPTSPAPGN